LATAEQWSVGGGRRLGRLAGGQRGAAQSVSAITLAIANGGRGGGKEREGVGGTGKRVSG